MKRLLTLFLLVIPGLVWASEHAHLDQVNIDLTDKPSLQRGARLFVNYCLSCHSARYMRYNRMGRDLGLTDKQVIDNLMFAAEKVGEQMKVAMPADDAAKWFGAAPPDLTLEARLRGPDWIYTYLRTFYLDPSRPFGVNNLVFPSVGMPHVLWQLQGWQKPVYKTIEHAGHKEKVIEKLELVSPGQLSPAKYDAAVRDLVNFMTYMAEPIKLKRTALGVRVLIFLAVFTVLSYLMKKEYWKDVH